MSKDVGSSLPPRRPPPGTTSLPPWLRAHRWAEPLLSCPLGYLRMLSASKPGTSGMVSTPGHWSLWVVTQPRKPSFQFWVTPTTSLSGHRLTGLEAKHWRWAFSPIPVLKGK